MCASPFPIDVCFHPCGQTHSDQSGGSSFLLCIHIIIINNIYFKELRDSADIIAGKAT